MTAWNFLTPLIGMIIGVAYGWIFLQSPANTPHSTAQTYSNLFKTIQFLAVRIILIGILWKSLEYVQNSIMLLTGCIFLASFWITVLKKKAYPCER